MSVTDVPIVVTGRLHSTPGTLLPITAIGWQTSD